MVSVVLCVQSTHLITSSSYIVDFEDCVVCETPDHFPNEYYISWRDTWFMCWGLVKYRPEPGEESDGSNFNDYEPPYSVVDPPSGHLSVPPKIVWPAPRNSLNPRNLFRKTLEAGQHPL